MESSIENPRNMIMANKLGAILNDQYKLMSDMNRSLNHIKELAADKLEYVELYQDQSQTTKKESTFNVDDYEKDFIEQLNNIDELKIQTKIIDEIKKKLNRNEEIDSVNKEYSAELELERDRYQCQPKYKRYAANKDFQEFRKTLWDVKSQGRTMPSLLDYTRQKYGQDDDLLEMDNEEGDDDIVITNRQESMICPLTKKIMTDPLISRRCEHSYSSVIKDYIRESNERRIECPVAGCVHFVTMGDLRPNKLLARKIRRKKFIEMEEEMEEREKYE